VSSPHWVALYLPPSVAFLRLAARYSQEVSINALCPRIRDPVGAVFPGRFLVLPRGPEAALTDRDCLNTDTVESEACRGISDRKLLRANAGQLFLASPLQQVEEDIFASTIAQDIWTGNGRGAKTRSNAVDRTNASPAAGRCACKTSPRGIYALSAGIKGRGPL